ncbi:MAG TPA: NAD-dependent epimerase/dehydratase family protein [Ferruginibacter sp.]|nr:NAD-dependent epimerase/dehydratase family protein [Ferruginibacter sp.]
MRWQLPYLSTIISEDISEIIAVDLPWQQFKDKTVLITGANGFLPAYMVYSFLALNDCKQLSIKIIALVRNKIKAEEKFKDIIKRKDFELIVQDVCDPITIENKVDYIIHAASQASPVFYGIDPVGTLAANTVGTYNLLNFAVKKNTTSFLFFSTGEVYGEVASDKIPTKENEFGYLDISNLRSCYAESKRLAEVMCVSFSKQFKINVKIVRPFHTYGPGMNLDDGRVYADFIADIINNRNIALKSDGNATRAFCYLKDATIGFFIVLLKGDNAQAYNIGNPEQEIRIKELALMLTQLFPEKRLTLDFKMSVNNDQYLTSSLTRNSPDITKVGILGWAPTTSVKEGFTRTINYFIKK